MAHIKLFVICLLLVFICSAWLSLAHSSQGQDVDVDSSAKGLMEHHERLATDHTSKRIKERKLAIDSIMQKQEKKKKKKEDGAVAGTTTSTNISRSNQVAGKYETSHEDQGIKGKSTSGSNVEPREGSSFARSSEVKNIDEAGFIPFNADYHPPRHHPPKNN